MKSGFENPSQLPFLNVTKIVHYLDINIGGVRIEDDVVITATGSEVLTKVPKTVKDIEDTMRK